MKAKSYKIKATALLTLLFCAVAMANPTSARLTKEKTIRKEFKVNANAMLKIQNSYGNLTLSSWEENRVVIEVHITTRGTNEDKVQRKLDGISIEFESNSNLVSARTHFEKNNSWSFWGKSENVQMEINYTIKMPLKNSVNLSNDYGSITLDQIDGNAKISCDYGRLNLGELRGNNNDLRFDYTSKSTIGYLKSGEINADYSGFTLDRAGDVVLKCDYTDTEIGNLDKLQYQCDYGNLEVRNVKNLIGNGDYISVNIGTISGNAEIDSNYGSLDIKKISNGFGTIKLDTNYKRIKIGYEADSKFDFEINTNYAEVKGIDSFNVNISKESRPSRYYKGNLGGSGSESTLLINSQYGNVTFENN